MNLQDASIGAGVMGLVVLLVILFFLGVLCFRNKSIKKQLRIKSAEVELVKAVGGEYGEKYEERSNNCEIINNANFND
jgi:hypothetical protein